MIFKRKTQEEIEAELKTWHRKFIFSQRIGDDQVFMQYVYRRAAQVDYDDMGMLVRWEYKL